MRLYHATTQQNLESIREHGLLVTKADATAKIKGVWLASASNRTWGTLHTIRKHKAQLDDVVVIEVKIPRTRLTRFRKGLWFTTQDVPPAWLGAVIPGATFGASASE